MLDDGEKKIERESLSVKLKSVFHSNNHNCIESYSKQNSIDRVERDAQ